MYFWAWKRRLRNGRRTVRLPGTYPHALGGMALPARGVNRARRRDPRNLHRKSRGPSTMRFFRGHSPRPAAKS